MMNFYWTSDLHLDILSSFDYESFMSKLSSLGDKDSYLLVTGDTSTCKHVTRHHIDLANNFQGRLLYVLGNHDRWNSHFAEAHNRLVQCNIPKDAVFLDVVDHVKVDNSTCVVGDSGWYDARNGHNSLDFAMYDWHCIEEYRGRNPIPISRSIADARASTVDHKLRDAASKGYKNIVFLTHIPPYVECCRHNGQDSDQEALAWFSSKIMGDTVDSFAKDHPDVKIEILCGHTHSGFSYRRSENVQVTVSSNDYYDPEVQPWKPSLW